MSIKKQNKKAVSEMISYVLLIVIALALAAGVYGWLKYYVPAQSEEKCSEEIALSINDYQCGNDPVHGKIINFTIQNKGLFNVRGFFIRASNNYSTLPVVMLNCTTNDPACPGTQSGLYRFDSLLEENGVLKPQQTVTPKFSYTGLDKIERIQIQPFIESSKTNTIILCDIISDIRIDGC